jgi:hypothetical protein
MVGPLLEHDRAVSPNIYGLSNGPSIIGQSLVPSGAPSARQLWFGWMRHVCSKNSFGWWAAIDERVRSKVGLHPQA